MRVVIFCANKEELTQLRSHFTTAYFIHGMVCAHIMTATLKAFLKDEDGVLITTECMAMGWRAPVGTKLLFTDGFPKLPNPIRLQAEARVMRPIPLDYGL